MRHAIPLAVMLLALPGAVSAELVEKEFHHSFPVDEETVLHLDHGDGDVTLTPWDWDEVEVSSADPPIWPSPSTGRTAT